LHLLIGAEPREVDRGVETGRIRHRARHQAAIIAPVKTDPWALLPRLILQVGGLVEFFVVVDAERKPTLPDGRTQAAALRAATLENTT
jgi:hypothetical protein